MEFKKLSQTQFKSKSAIIAEQLIEMLRTGVFRVGQKLPPERIIAEQMGVSRPSVREAISALQIGGILDTRPGDGTYVTHSPAANDVANQAISVLETSDSPYDILQARRAIEIGVIRLAIEVASDEDISALKRAYTERNRTGKKGNFEEYTMYGKDFHLTIAKATKNRVIINMMDKLLDAMQQPLWVNMRKAYYKEDPSRIDQMLEVHNDIVNAIIERDAEKAVHALEADFDHVLQQLYSFNE
jgi:GntR family transcriptional regulator, transcriptional repressor for pyruvate dehydrogenase complex